MSVELFLIPGTMIKAGPVQVSRVSHLTFMSVLVSMTFRVFEDTDQHKPLVW